MDSMTDETPAAAPIPLNLADLRPGVIWRVFGLNFRIIEADTSDQVREHHNLLGPSRWIAKVSTNLRFVQASSSGEARVDLGDDSRYPARSKILLADGAQAWSVMTVTRNWPSGPVLEISLLRDPYNDVEPVEIDAEVPDRG